jgi:hypothetical protein
MRRTWEGREGVRLVVHAVDVVDAVLTVHAALVAATLVVID